MQCVRNDQNYHSKQYIMKLTAVVNKNTFSPYNLASHFTTWINKPLNFAFHESIPSNCCINNSTNELDCNDGALKHSRANTYSRNHFLRVVNYHSYAIIIKQFDKMCTLLCFMIIILTDDYRPLLCIPEPSFVYPDIHSTVVQLSGCHSLLDHILDQLLSNIDIINMQIYYINYEH